MHKTKYFSFILSFLLMSFVIQSDLKFKIIQQSDLNKIIQKNKSDYLFQVFNRSFFDFWKVYDMKPYVTFDNKLVDSVITQIWHIQKYILTSHHRVPNDPDKAEFL